MQIIIFVEYCGRKNENEWRGCPPNGYLVTLQKGAVTVRCPFLPPCVPIVARTARVTGRSPDKGS